MKSELFLLTAVPGGPVLSFTLTKGRHILGRSSRCEFVVRHESISRQHAAIHVEERAVSVHDLESRNGTFIDEKRIQVGQIEDGQQVRFGKVPFIVSSSQQQAGLLDSGILTVSVQGRLAASGIAIEEALSLAQRRVLHLLLDGLAEKEIAARLKLSPHTVHNHVRAIYEVFEVHSRPELFAKLLREKA